MAETHGRRTSSQPSRGYSPASVNNAARYGRATPVAGGGQRGKSVNAKMGIKSGMTVEDLKRLTQQRMQQNPSIPATTTATPASSHSPPHPSNITIPALNMSVANGVNSVGTPTNALPPGVPKAGMTVQELKQLTSLRLATQHQQEITGLMNKAAMSNAAKSQYRDGLRGPPGMAITPSTTPKRSSAPNIATPPLRTYGHVPYPQPTTSSPPPPPHYVPENGMVMMQQRHSMPGRMMKTGHPTPPNMYGYPYGGGEQFSRYDQNQVVRQGVTTIQVNKYIKNIGRRSDSWSLV